MKKLERIKKFDIQVLEGAEYLNDTSLAEIKGGIMARTCDGGGKYEVTCECNKGTLASPCNCKGEGSTYSIICKCNAGTLEVPPIDLLGLIQFE